MGFWALVAGWECTNAPHGDISAVHIDGMDAVHFAVARQGSQSVVELPPSFSPFGFAFVEECGAFTTSSAEEI